MGCDAHKKYSVLPDISQADEIIPRILFVKAQAIIKNRIQTTLGWRPEIVSLVHSVSDLLTGSAMRWLSDALLPGEDNQLLASLSLSFLKVDNLTFSGMRGARRVHWAQELLCASALPYCLCSWAICSLLQHVSGRNPQTKRFLFHSYSQTLVG